MTMDETPNSTNESQQQDEDVANEILFLTTTMDDDAGLVKKNMDDNTVDDTTASKQKKKDKKKKKKKKPRDLAEAKPAYIGGEDEQERTGRVQAQGGLPFQQQTRRNGSQSVNSESNRPRPGAFRVFINGRRRRGGDEDSYSSNNESRQQSLPFAHVSRVVVETTRNPLQHDEEQFAAELEAHPGDNNLNVTEPRRREKEEEEDYFWIIVASIFTLLVIGAVVATIVLVRGGDNDNDTGSNNNNIPPTPAPAFTNDNIFADNNYPTEWDDYQFLFLFAVQVGFDADDCELRDGVSANMFPKPKVQMSCSSGGYIAFRAARYYNGNGEAVLDGDQYSGTCTHGDTTDTLLCTVPTMSRESTTPEKQPTITWLIGCAANQVGVTLEVESTLSVDDKEAVCEASTASSTIFLSHSMSIGMLCGSSSPMTNFLVAQECSKGVGNTVSRAPAPGNEELPFCGQFGSCTSDGSAPCAIENSVASVQMTTASLSQEQCAITKDTDSQSFFNAANGRTIWGELSGIFMVVVFASRSHLALTEEP